MCASRPVYDIMYIKIWSKDSAHGHQKKPHLVALLSSQFQVSIPKLLEGALKVLFSLKGGYFIYDEIAAFIAIWNGPARDFESGLTKSRE